MSRIGSTISSAKMNAITPPKLITPFHSTAASGTLPIEQTNDTTATSGPTSGPTAWPAADGRPGRSPARTPLGPRRPTPRRSAGQRRVDPNRGPVYHEEVAGGGQPPGRAQPRPDRSLGDRHVHV